MYTCAAMWVQVILRWIISKKVVPNVRSYTYSRQVDNFDVFGWDLADEDINAIDSIKEKRRILDGDGLFANSKGSPIKDVNEIWDEWDANQVTWKSQYTTC